MKKEFIFKREDGTRHRIDIEFLLNHKGYFYRVSVYVCPSGKRTFKKIDVTDDYIFRGLPFGGKERAEFELNEFLKYVTKSEIMACKLDTWQALKPEFV